MSLKISLAFLLTNHSNLLAPNRSHPDALANLTVTPRTTVDVAAPQFAVHNVRSANPAHTVHPVGDIRFQDVAALHDAALQRQVGPGAVDEGAAGEGIAGTEVPASVTLHVMVCRGHGSKICSARSVR